MKPRLLLFVEEDFILPVACEAEGRFHHDEARWMYFCTADSSVTYSRSYGAKIRSHTTGYHGDILAGVAAGRLVEINGTNFGLFELLKQSSFLEDIKTFYKRETLADVISTEYIFADSIGMKERKAFISAMKGEDFIPVAYAKEPSELYLQEVEKSRICSSFSLGDNILIINSAMEGLRLSCAVHDGQNWLMDAACECVQGVGESPLKRAIVECVVKDVDRNRGFLATETDRIEEVEFQMANADRWLEVYRSSKDRFYIRNFVYSHASDESCQCDMPRKFIESAYRNSVDSALSAVRDYRDKVCGKALRAVVLTGPAFEDENFAHTMIDAIGNPASVIVTSDRLLEAMDSYCRSGMFVENSFDNFDKFAATREREQKTVKVWVSNAFKINKLLEELQAGHNELNSLVRTDKERIEEELKLIDGHLARSAFDEADAAVNKMAYPSARTSDSISSSRYLFSVKEKMGGVFAELGDNPAAKVVINRINSEYNAIVGLIDEADACAKTVEEERAAIAKYRNSYEKYLELRRQFARSSDPKELKKLVVQMRPLTRETLPEITVREVNATLSGAVKVSKKGLFKKQRTLEVGFSVEAGDVLPYEAVMIVSTSVQIGADVSGADCIVFDVPKGVSSFSEEIPLPDNRLEQGKPIRLYLFASPSVKIGRNAIVCKSMIINE